MKDKLKLPKRRRSNPNCATSIRVKPSTMRVIDDIFDSCCLSKIEIIDKLVKFAADHIEWTEYED